MRLVKLELHNYRQHRDRSIDFGGNIIGIVGRNGSGKSNLLGSIQFAFSGEQPGAKRSELLSWGAREGHVELEFVHNGVTGVLSRALHNSNAVLTYGSEEYTGITAVGAAIENLFGLDKDLLRQTIFVRQAEIDNVLFTDPRLRELAFQRLCGVGDAAKIHKRLGDVINTMAAPQDFDTQIAEGLKRRAELEARLTELRRTVATVEERRRALPDLGLVQTRLQALGNVQQSLTRIDQIKLEIGTKQGELAPIVARLAQLPEPSTQIADLDTQISSLYETKQAAINYQRLLAECREADAAVAQLGSEPTPIPIPVPEAALAELQRTADDYTAKYNAAVANLQTFSELAAVVAKLTGVECPVCGNHIKDTTRLTRLVEGYRQEAATYAPDALRRKVEDAKTSNHAAAMENQRKLQAYVSDRDQRMLRQARARTSLEQSRAIELDVAAIDAALAEANRIRTATLAVITERQSLLTRHASIDATVKRMAEEYDAAVKHICTVIPDFNTQDMAKHSNAVTEQIQAGNAAVAQRLDIENNFATLKGMMTELETNLQALAATLVTLEAKRAQQSARKDAIGTLTAVRDWFHYLNGPHAITAAVLQEMTADVNKFLEYFNAPFVVHAATDVMGYKTEFVDGRDMPAELPDATALSGGEKVLLAIAFRFASYCIFASKQGILCLDEPTVYLDANNIGHFCTLLERIKDLAKQMDLQVLIATHETAVMSFCDTVADIVPA